MTGNTTEDGADEQRVLDTLQRADATLSFLFPYERKDIDEDGDPIIPSADKKKRRWPTQDPTPPHLKHSAPATAPHEAGAGLIAQDAGGDGSVFVDEYALTEMLRRLGQRYTLWVDSSGPTPPEKLLADLTSEARSRYPSAVVHFRVLYHAGHEMEELMVPMNLMPEEQNKKRKAVNEQPN